MKISKNEKSPPLFGVFFFSSFGLIKNFFKSIKFWIPYRIPHNGLKNLTKNYLQEIVYMPIIRFLLRERPHTHKQNEKTIYYDNLKPKDTWFPKWGRNFFICFQSLVYTKNNYVFYFQSYCCVLQKST